LRTAPADRNDRGLVYSVMDCAVDGAEKALCRIRGEVHHNFSPRGNRGGDFNIEHNFAVRPIRVACGLVFSAVHRDRRDLRHRKPKPGEIGLQVLSEKPTPQFDYSDALTCAIRSGREIVKFGQIRRGITYGLSVRPNSAKFIFTAEMR